MMNFISVLGIPTLLLLAFLLSFNKKQIKFRPIFWGIGLQFLFAVIILIEDFWSFIGMGLLGLMIITFILQKDNSKLGGGVKAMTIISSLCVLVGGLIYLLSPAATWILLATFIYMLINSKFKFNQTSQRYVGVIFVITSIVYLISNKLYGQVIFRNISEDVANFLNLSDYGSKFLFGNLADPNHFFPGDKAGWPGFGFQFAFKVLPTIIFFGGFMSVLYFLGIMQKIIESMSRFMRWTIGTSGAETLSCSANIFVGQTEAPLLIKPFLENMTASEITTIMVGGFATIAGGVLAGYVAMGVPANHLIAASVMSAPAALVIGKIIYPETEHSQTAGDVALPNVDAGRNVIEAASSGITDGFHLALNVGAMLIGFLALIAVVDVVLNSLDSIIDGRILGGAYIKYKSTGLSPAVGEYAGIFPGSLQTLFGTIFKPLAFMMGVPWKYASEVGNLLGIKISLNEFVAYGTLTDYIKSGAIDERSKIIATYALCGFANFASIGIQIGGICALSPSKRSVIGRVGLRAMFGGAIASWLTATIAGIFI